MFAARVDRREFIKTTVTTVSALGVLACGDDAQPQRREPEPEPEPNDGATLTAFDVDAYTSSDELFPRGVQSGGMTASSVVLLTHATGPSGLNLRVWRDAGVPGSIKLVHQREVQVEQGFVKVKVEGLGPGRYQFAFFDETAQARSRVGRFRTAFAETDLRPLTLAGMACTNLTQAPFTAQSMTAEQEPDVLVHLGDMIYADDAETLEAYREVWSRTLSDPGYKDVFASAGLYATWDDHEIVNNPNPETIDPLRLAAAKQAYLESVAIETDPEGRIWRSHRWGHTAEIFVLDSRTERRPSTRSTPDATYLGQAQMSWLLGALEASPCAFKIILNSVPFSRLAGLWEVGVLDRWEGYAAQRELLLSHLLDRRIENVFFLSGDFHCAFISKVEPTGPGNQFWEILVGPSAPRSPNPIAALADSGDLPREDVFPESQFLFGTGNRFSTTELTFDPLNMEVRARFVSARELTLGQVLFDGLVPLTAV